MEVDLSSGIVAGPDGTTVFSDYPYVYSLSGSAGGGPAVETSLKAPEYSSYQDEVSVIGRFESLPIEMTQHIRLSETSFEESISLRNVSEDSVELTNIGLGFSANLGTRREWRLCAIPFKVQLDGSRHDYPVDDLISGNYHNATYSDSTRPEPGIIEAGRLRSEAWAWWDGEHGLTIIKYNSRDIELSVAAPSDRNGETLRFGGVGTSLYREPCRGHFLLPGEEFSFGPSHYIYFDGPIENAFDCYRTFLDDRAHRFPVTYDPPVNWNELYDIGWHHSDHEALAASYTRSALLQEAQKAKDCGCEMLYLDPGWEVAEGTTLWDEERLGSVGDFVETLHADYGLRLGIRTILRCYRDRWPERYLVQHEGEKKGPIDWPGQPLWELCLCDTSFRIEKIRRLQSIVEQGVRFLMVDEMDWRGPCSDENHSHNMPTSAGDHIEAVYELCSSLRKENPNLRIECHDPVWPWHTSIYVPSYFRHGFGEDGAYDENWGFEYMWDCINDLTTGRALALYYYNLACNIPLYLHITMAADNDSCLFFWWAASTIRHLGIGGMSGHPTVNPKGIPAHEPWRRFAAYREQMRLYRRLKPYFVRGEFVGISEHAHLHVLPDHTGGVLVLYNLSEETRTVSATIGLDHLSPGIGSGRGGSETTARLEELASTSSNTLVESANLGESISVSVEIAGLSPAILTFGDAVK